MVSWAASRGRGGGGGGRGVLGGEDGGIGEGRCSGWLGRRCCRGGRGCRGNAVDAWGV